MQERERERERERVINNCRYDKSYSVGAGEQFAASFIMSRWCGYLQMSTTPEKIVLHNARERERERERESDGNEVGYLLGVSCISQ